MQRVRTKVEKQSDDDWNASGTQAESNLASNKQFECDICKVNFATDRQAKYHKWKKHTEGKLKCPHCPKTWHKSQLYKVHVLVCAKKKFSCELCDKKFQTPSGLKQHKIGLHHVEESTKNVKIEKTDCTEKPEKIATQEALQSIVDDPSSASCDGKCSHCERSFSDEGSLRRHIEQSHVPWVCDICGVTFDNLIKWRYHKYTRHVEPRYQCPHCPSPFLNVKRYEAHLAVCMSKKFSCDLCEKKFKKLSSAIKHGRLAHHDMAQVKLKLKPFVVNETDLLPQIDEVRLVFQCTICNWYYMNMEGMNKHINLHKEIVGDSKELHHQEIRTKVKLHQCDLCKDQRAYSEGPYWKHVHDIHDGFFLRCTECGENFRSEELMNCHTDSHCEARKQSSHADENLMFPVKSEPMSSDSMPDMDAKTKGIDKTDNETDVLPTVESAEESLSCTCEICGIPFPSKTAAYYHKKMTHGEMNKCRHCRKRFLIEDYYTHLSVCEKNRIPCEMCDATFLTSKTLTKHMEHMHHVRKEDKRQQVHADKEQILKHADPTFECDKCSKKYHMKGDFKIHYSTCDPFLKSRRHYNRQRGHTEPGQIDLMMEIKVEEATLEQRDDCGNESGDAFNTDLHGNEPINEAIYDGSSKFRIKKECPEEEYSN